MSHCFLSLIYGQNNNLKNTISNFIFSSEKYRYYTDVSKFALKYDLGDAIAGNFFEAQWDNCVDDVLDDLDEDSPEYIDNAEDRCDLPPNPNESDSSKSRVKKPFNRSTVKTKKFSYFGTNA